MITLDEAQARARIADLTRQRPRRPFLLGIAGEPGSGKSTLAEGSGAPVLAMDGFHLANEELARRGLREKKGAPDTFDVGGFASALARLRSGEDVVAPRFDRALEAAIAGAVPLSAASALIVAEGNYLLHDSGGWQRIRPLLDEVWFIRVNGALRRRRLVDRHRRFGRSAAAAETWVATVDEPNAALIRATGHRADAIVHQNS